MSKAWGKGSTTRWRRIRAAVLRENQYTNDGRCVLQLDGCEGQANQVHHVLGKEHGDDPNYLVAVCGHCNGKVGDPKRWRGPEPKQVSSW